MKETIYDKHNPLIEKDLKQELGSKKTEITIEKNGERINIWVEYEIEPSKWIGSCSCCKKENREMWIEKVTKVQVKSDDLEVIAKAEKKLRKKEVDRKNLESEFADMIFQLSILADMHDVDFEKAVENKYKILKDRHNL